MRIGFIPLELKDFLDIAVVAMLVYLMYRFVRGTVGVQIAVGLAAIYFLDVVVRFLGLTTLQALFGALSEVFLLALIVLFHPEIRRLLFLMNRNPLVRRLVPTTARERVVEEVVRSVEQMSRDRVGSLIALARSTGLRNYAETGTHISADVDKDLLTSIFFPNSPLHDGAVIIQDNRIEAARCILPLSEAGRLDPHFGLRHRAAVGLSERTDAFVIVTSEETGRISVAENGVLHSNLTPASLQARLVDAFVERRREAEAVAAESPDEF